jgi:hypothetical protein
MTREPLAVSGSKSAGAWKPNAQGFCTSWGSARRRVAFTVVPIGENKWNRDYYRRHGCGLVQITIGTLPRVRAVQRSVAHSSYERCPRYPIAIRLRRSRREAISMR